MFRSGKNVMYVLVFLFCFFFFVVFLFFFLVSAVFIVKFILLVVLAVPVHEHGYSLSRA